jgi:hypothetical protein
MSGNDPGLRQSAHAALGLTQAALGLFAAGTVIYEIHSMFLRLYAQEWAAIQMFGPNRCAGVAMIANGDIYAGKTFCNDLINMFPWAQIYANHADEAAAYYGAAGAVMLLIAWGWRRARRRPARKRQRRGP